MKYISNISVRLTAAAAKLASESGIVLVDAEGMFTTVALFLSGENPWGLHQDYSFSSNLSAIRMGKRIADAALAAQDRDAGSEIELSDEEHSMLLRVLAAPDPSGLPMPPMLAREVLPLYEAIERATSTPKPKQAIR